ncbi:MAG: DUF3570 domain-containing protein [Owenweeksia sp.]|nr:DUF3570 domain-containing protein [Owenweeksia sp.]
MHNFGINSHTFKLEAPYKIKPSQALAPFVRLFHQQGSRYFNPYKEHQLSQVFYTSDYDLSKFWSASVGLNYRWLFGNNLPGEKYKLSQLNLRYSYYHRQDGLVPICWAAA